MVPILLYNRSIKRELLAYKSITKSCGIEGFWHFTTTIWKMVIFGNYLWLQHYVAG